MDRRCQALVSKLETLTSLFYLTDITIKSLVYENTLYVTYVYKVFVIENRCCYPHTEDSLLLWDFDIQNLIKDPED